MIRVFLGLGSNKGDRWNNLNMGCMSISLLPKVEFIQNSSIYETEPLYNCQQPHFLNMVIEILTSFSPYELLNELKAIEYSLGRDISNGHNSPRNLDIDILDYGSQRIIYDDLIIPHPKIIERKFVLQPWSDITENFILVGPNQSIKYLLDHSSDGSKVELSKFNLELTD